MFNSLKNFIVKVTTRAKDGSIFYVFLFYVFLIFIPIFLGLLIALFFNGFICFYYDIFNVLRGSIENIYIFLDMSYYSLWEKKIDYPYSLKFRNLIKDTFFLYSKILITKLNVLICFLHSNSLNLNIFSLLTKNQFFNSSVFFYLILCLTSMFLSFITIWTRSAGPRVRLEQLSKLTWKDFLFILFFSLIVILLIIFFS